MSGMITGKAAVRGIAIGRAVIFNPQYEDVLSTYRAGSPEEEEEKYRSARGIAAKAISDAITRARSSHMREQAEIMEAHLCLLEDPVLEDSILEKIRQFHGAPRAVINSSEETAELLSSVEDPYIKERAADIRDVGMRVAGLILHTEKPDLESNGSVIFGSDIAPSVIADSPPGRIIGMVLGKGSLTSHTVIMARAKGIVTVSGLGDKVNEINQGALVIVDGDEGRILIDPDNETLREYQARLIRKRAQKESLLKLSELPCVTKDGVHITLSANIGNPQDIHDTLLYPCDGIGLFRTEFVFLGRQSLPTEDEQYEAYKTVIEKCEDKLCVIRTMDIGGDKPLPYLKMDKEENPFLGWRAIRISLERTDLFMTQIKAILRAGVYGRVAIMLPMIISPHEVLQAKEWIRLAMAELKSEGKPYTSDIEVGIMVETPAAAILSPALAKLCDFFSIGTNDLVQYTLAVDRGNPHVSELYSYYHPAVLKLIHATAQAAQENGIWVGMCGEMAGDPLASELLASMGIHELSMSPPSLPEVKEVLLHSRIDRDLVQKVMTFTSSDQVLEYLRERKPLSP